VQQIAVRAVELDGIDTEPRGTLGRRSEGFTHPREALSVEGDRRVLAVLVRDRRRRDRLPAVCMIGCDLHPVFPRYLRRGLATGVRQLNGNLHVGPAADAFQHPGDRGFCRVVPESHIGVGDPCVGQDGSRLDGQQRRTRERKMAEMDEVPVGHAAIDGRVLAHRRDNDPVGQFEGTDPKRCKQRAHANFSMSIWNRQVGIGRAAYPPETGFRVISVRRSGFRSTSFDHFRVRWG
jgi:hypothetical protein